MSIQLPPNVKVKKAGPAVNAISGAPMSTAANNEPINKATRGNENGAVPINRNQASPTDKAFYNRQNSKGAGQL